MRPLATALDGVAVALAALGLAVIATGGWTILGVPITRPEDVVVAIAVVVGLRALVQPFRVREVDPQRVVVVGVAVYVALMSFIVMTGHHALRTHALDLGYYVQVVWNIAQGHGAWVTMPPMHAWGDHLSPILVAFVPLALLWPGAAPLLIGQTIILAAGAWAVFGLGSRRLKDWHLAGGLGLAYLVNPSLHGINLRDLHPQAFAIPLILAAAFAVDRRRYRTAAAWLLLTLATREDAAVAVVGFGIWLALARRRWRAAALVVVASVAVLALDVSVVMPYFRGGPYRHLGRYSHLGGSLGEIVTSLILRPWRWMVVVATPAKLAYLAAMLAPLGFLPLLAPAALAAALPGLAMNLVSLDPRLFHYRTQYQSFVLPFLVLAAIDGVRVLRFRLERTKGERRISPEAAIAVGLLASVVLTARTVDDFAVSRWRLGPEQRAAYRLIDFVPPTASISANERLVPHLATREAAFVFPGGVPESEYVLDRATVAPKVPTRYALVAREGPWALWRRE